MMAIIASVILALGLIPPYFELAKRKGRVIGIDFIFLTVDWFGAFFSLMALVAQNTFDYLGGSLYIVCLFLELGIFISQVLWLYRTRKIRHLAKKCGKTYDEYIAEANYREPNWQVTENTEPKINEDMKPSPEPTYNTLRGLEKCVTKEPKDSNGVSHCDFVDLEKGMAGAAPASNTLNTRPRI